MSWTKSAIKCPKKVVIIQGKKVMVIYIYLNEYLLGNIGHFMISIKDIIPQNELNDIKSVVILNSNKSIPIINNFKQQSTPNITRSMADELQLEVKNDTIMANNTEKDAEIQRLNVRISSYERQLIGKDETINNLQMQNQELRAQIDRYRQNDDELRRINNQLQDEHKQMEMKYNELKIEYEQVKRDRLDVKNYLDWKAKDVVEWIMSLENQRFMKYKDLLLSKFVKDNVDGPALNDMDAGDLTQFGINDFKDRKCLIKHIKSLKNKDADIDPMHDPEALMEQEGQNGTAMI